MVLTEEQALLKHTAHAYFADKLPVKALRKLRDEHDPLGFDRACWREMAAMGWAGILIPETYGGVNFGYTGLGQILEESGRTLAATPLISTVLLASTVVLAGGTAAHKDEVLPAIAAGERIVSLALEERPRHAPTRIETYAAPTVGGYLLSGTKTFVLDGHLADQLIVVARTSGAVEGSAGITLFLVDASLPGITRTRTAMVDNRNAATVSLNTVHVTHEAMIGPLDDGFALLDAALDATRLGLAAEMLGSGLEAFERTLKYLKLRTQFGVPIGSFQALKHRASLMFCELELTKSTVLAGLKALDEGSATVPELASLAKAKACEMLELVTSEAIQLHGGIGMTDAEDIGLFLKRARVAQQTFGDAAFHRARYADLKGF